jgi:GNAT superfamily N-acetyltransferase
VTVHVRDGRPGEGRRIEELRIAGWQAYRGLFPDEFLDAQQVDDARVEQHERRLTAPSSGEVLLVAAAHGELVGMAHLGPSRDADLPDAVELYALYVDLTRRYGGIGTALMTTGFARFPQPLQTLWTLTGNAAGRRFYERHGFSHDGAEKVLDQPGRPSEVRYRRTRLD